MKTQVTLDYNTAWGERLVLCVGKKRIDMKCVYAGLWQAELTAKAGEKYTYEVWDENGCIRKEWLGHEFPECGAIIHDRWNECPQNAPFYSSLFKDVVFARPASKTPVKANGNVTFMFRSAEIRSNQTIAITGSGKTFNDWKKFVVMDDSEFPLWKVSLNVKENFEYKFVIVDKKTLEPQLWETGGNRFFTEVPAKGDNLVVADVVPNFPTLPWRGAGTAVPVFSLRTEESFGVGEFTDIKKLVDWAVETGQNVIQLLPINDTTMTGTWQDSYPYNANSTFALHPQFINLLDAGVRNCKTYRELRDELNSLPQIDYERVNNEKTRLLRKAFATAGKKIASTEEYKEFMDKNGHWLLPYAAFCCLRDINGTADFSKWGKFAKYTDKKVRDFCAEHQEDVDFWCYEQFCLDKQLKDAVAYAHAHGVCLKGDLPIGISRTSVDAWAYPQLYHLDSQAGAPPDAFSTFGQNWGFPTYNWEKMAEDDFAWWKSRMRKMSEYFDAFRIDHILGFFRIWEIPMDAVHGLLGYFNPALPYSAEELAAKGFDMGGGRYSKPIVADWVIAELFGGKADEVHAKYIVDGALAPAVDTQRKIEDKFKGDEEIKNGLMTLLDDVLFIEDPRRPGYFHPRISAQSTYSYRALDEGLKASFNALYNDFFYHRHNQFWAESAMRKLPSLLGTTDMLTCGEDLGMIPACVPDVMKNLGILSLEIQRMPKSVIEEFANPAAYPYYCVCATGTHDTSPLRAWWEEDPASTERFYHSMLHCGGDAPAHCEPWVCEKIVDQHLFSPAMLAILPLQDWLSIDGSVRYQGNPADERINIPANPRHYWRYRMHLTLEQLLAETELNNRLRDKIRNSGRNI